MKDNWIWTNLTNALGLLVSSNNLDPTPPANITHFIFLSILKLSYCEGKRIFSIF